MKVEQLMTRDVVTVAPETPLREVAAVLTERRISGVPVCADNGRLLGVLSGRDLLHKEQAVPRTTRGVLDWLLEKGDGEMSRVRARTAGEAMSAPAVTIDAAASVSDAARIMLQRRIDRLPVVSDRELVGILTRTDLVRAFARPDAEIATEVADDVLRRTLWLDDSCVGVTVDQGIVGLDGEVETRTLADLAAEMTACVPGVVDVRSALRWRVDDRAVRWSLLGADR